jgi:integrase
MATQNITTAKGRARLPVSKEPCFHKLTKGRFIGYRKTAAGGTWVARHTKGKTKTHLRLGTDSELPEYEDAQKLATEWFNRLAGDLTVAGPYTVGECFEDYIRELGIKKNAKAAAWARQRYELRIEKQFRSMQVSRLSTARLNKWRDDMVIQSDNPDKVRASKDTANRMLTVFKAALNRAFKQGAVASDSEWRRVEKFKGVSRSRKAFLTAQQCRWLIDACDPAFGALVKSAVLCGARLGELLDTTVRDFDRRQGTLHVEGKTGIRDIVLNNDAVEHFKQLCKDKLPAALLHVRSDGLGWGRSHQQRPFSRAVDAANSSITDPKDRIPLDAVFYTLRHSHASLALLAGVNPQVLAENMGTSLEMLERHYGKFFQSDRRAMFDAVQFM